MVLCNAVCNRAKTKRLMRRQQNKAPFLCSDNAVVGLQRIRGNKLEDERAVDLEQNEQRQTPRDHQVKVGSGWFRELVVE